MLTLKTPVQKSLIQGRRLAPGLAAPLAGQPAGRPATRAAAHLAARMAARLAGMLLLTAAAVAAPAALAAPSLSFVATPNPASAGSTVELDVRVAGIADLYAYQFSLSFDPSVLRASGYGAGAFLSSAGAASGDGGTVDNAAGTISFAYGSLLGAVPGASGGGSLARFRFDVIGSGGGATTLNFGDVLFLDSGLNDIAVRYGPQTVAVSSVPEPSAYLMFGMGLAGIAALRRKAAPAA